MQRNSSSESPISIINSTCLFEIFKQIKIQCESQQDVSNENPVDHEQLIPNDDEENGALIVRENDSRIDKIGNVVKYLDLIRFAKSCQWITKLFYFWDKILSFQLIHRFDLEIDLDHIYDEIKGLPKKDQDTFFKFFVEYLSDSTQVPIVELTYKCETYYENYLEVFVMIMNALQNKCHSKFKIDVKGYTLENVPCCCGLSELYLNVRTNAEELVKWCKSNPNLRKLSLMNNEIYGRLSDITLDENDLQNLEELEFLMKTDVNAAEYAPLAKLPNLRILTIHGQHEIGSLGPLFHGLGDNNPHRFLSTLKLVDAAMNDEETYAISQIKCLKNLSSRFIETQSIGHLSQLSELIELDILSNHEHSKILPEISKILKATKKFYIRIKFYDFPVPYTKFNDELDSNLRISKISISRFVNERNVRLDITTLIEGDEFMSQIKYAKYFELGTFENCHSFAITGQCKTSSLHLLIQALATNQNNNLKELDIKNYQINFEESFLISQIESLEKLVCTFSDPRSFEVIYPKTNCKKIRINGTQFPNQIIGFLNYSNGNVTIRNEFQQMTYYKSQGKLILENVSSEIFNADGYTFLGNLDDLQILHIIFDFKNDSQTYLNHKRNSFTKLFGTLTVKQELKELIIEERNNEYKINMNSLDPFELLAIAQLTSLRKIKCGFSDSENIQNLAQLKELQDLTITTHQRGTLHILFQGLSSPLQFLTIEKEITFDELKTICKIKSLRSLECSFTNTKNEDALPTLPHLRELCIKSHRQGTLFDKLRLFKNTVLQNIIIRDPLDARDADALAQCKTLKAVHISLSQLENTNRLLPLKELEELQIEKQMCDTLNLGLIKEPFNIEKNFRSLRKLVIRDHYINDEEITNILQLPALKSLNCIFDIDEAANLEGLEKIEELFVKSISNSLNILLQTLIEKSSSAIKTLVISRYDVDMETMALLSQITSLTSLKFQSCNYKSLHILKDLINLETLKIMSEVMLPDIWDSLLIIARDCPKLELIQLRGAVKIFELDMLAKAFKSVRDPILQKPLKLIWT